MNISVVIPLYNKSNYIVRALECVSSQSRQPDEVLVVDDGSTDDGPEKVRAFGNSLVRLISQVNCGVSRARNTGCEAAKGRFVAFLDADDWWREDHLASLWDLASTFPDAAIYGTAYVHSWPNGKQLMVQLSGCTEGVIPDYFRVSRYHPLIFTSSIMVSRDKLLKVGGFPAGVSHGEDLDTWARLALCGEVVYSPAGTAFYSRDVQGQATTARTFSSPPIFRTLLHALENPEYGVIHGDIRDYLSANIPFYLQKGRLPPTEVLEACWKYEIPCFSFPADWWPLVIRHSVILNFLVKLQRFLLYRIPLVSGALGFRDRAALQRSL